MLDRNRMQLIKRGELTKCVALPLRLTQNQPARGKRCKIVIDSISTSQNWHGRGFPSLDKRDYQSIL
jgi:hypothetical protein